MPLWKHQQDALALLQKYLDSGSAEGAALVSMPTGTGKSAVIANLAASEEVVAGGLSVFVITPWRGLASQLRHDIDSRVWERLEVPRPANLPNVLLVGTAKGFIARLRDGAKPPAIYLATFAMALKIFNTLNNDRDEMAKLFERVAAVVVDESHYEPAPSWSEAVRASRRPICLFTATPFRNDNRMFELREDAQFRFSHDAAVSEAILREPKFVSLEPNLPMPEFVTRLLEVADEHLLPGERVIVRCGGHEEVESIARELIDRGKKVLAVHEQFAKRTDASHLRQSVPAPSHMPAVDFYVHQFKLTEGFDDPAVRILAIRDDFGNDRARIQQIGRVLRNASRQKDSLAIVLTSSAKVEHAWRRYRLFDKQDKTRSVATDPMGVADLLRAQPELFYWERLFRERAELTDPEAWKKLKFRLSAVVRMPHAGVDFDFDLFVDRVSDDLMASNIQVLNTSRPDTGVAVMLQLTVRNSPVLLEAAYVEAILGYTVLHWDGRHLFVSSTTSLPNCVREDTRPVPAGKMAGLLPESATVTSVSLSNNDLGEWAIKTRSLTARDLGLIASEVGESTYGYASASGSLEIDGDRVTRYTGARNGRVSDARQTEGRYSDLRSWYREVTELLSFEAKPAASIARYGTPQPTPLSPEAEHVLLDIDPEAFVADDGGGRSPDLERRGAPVQDGRFSIELDGEEVEVSVRWDDHQKRFEVNSSIEVPYRSASDPNVGFWRAITRDQSIRVAISGGLVYSSHNFWSLSMRGADEPDGLMSVLEPRKELEHVSGEKGHTVGQIPWPKDTVFGVVERIFESDKEHAMETVLCTDLGREIADFIAIDDRKVVFAHAKSKKESAASIISASALHEVVSQAMKSLRYLTIGNEEPPNVNVWNKDWEVTLKGGVILGPASRVRRGQLGSNAQQYWRSINAVIQSHASTREVWLVLGACLSKSALMEELGKAKPRAEALQAHALLTGAWSAAQQCGVRLRVFCSP